VHKNEAVKIALRDYALQADLRIPRGFAINPAFGPAAVELTKRIQKRGRFKQTGEITPEVLLLVGRWLPGSTVGQRAEAIRAGYERDPIRRLDQRRLTGHYGPSKSSVNAPGDGP
jgi:hypothetical protein